MPGIQDYVYKEIASLVTAKIEGALNFPASAAKIRKYVDLATARIEAARDRYVVVLGTIVAMLMAANCFLVVLIAIQVCRL